ncbi:MAG: 50S ribosomal protein L9 [Proteobacteria bacterium]|nr:MAG: 50S ribosomal protein L9 [Pseudomonadota bacterium]
MEIILLDRIHNLGDLGDLVKVKPGYARNYLIPQQLAVPATEEARHRVEERRKELAKLAEERLKSSRARADLAGRTVSLARKVASEEGHLFGSVSPQDIAEALSTDDVTIERAEVAMPDGPIKELGTYELEIILHPEVRFMVSVEVVAEA